MQNIAYNSKASRPWCVLWKLMKLSNFIMHQNKNSTKCVGSGVWLFRVTFKGHIFGRYWTDIFEISPANASSNKESTQIVHKYKILLFLVCWTYIQKK